MATNTLQRSPRHCATALKVNSHHQRDTTDSPGQATHRTRIVRQQHNRRHTNTVCSPARHRAPTTTTDYQGTTAPVVGRHNQPFLSLPPLHNTRKRSRSRARHCSRTNHGPRDTREPHEINDATSHASGPTFAGKTTTQRCTDGLTHLQPRRTTRCTDGLTHLQPRRTTCCTDGLTRLQPCRTSSCTGKPTRLQFRRPHAQHRSTCCTGRLTRQQLHRVTLRIIITTTDDYNGTTDASSRSPTIHFRVRFLT